MTPHFKTNNYHPFARTELSDSLVGLVRPRVPAGRRRSDTGIAMAFGAVMTPYSTVMRAAVSLANEFNGTGDALLSLTEDRSQPFRHVEPRRAAKSSMAPDEAAPSSSVKSNDMLKRKRSDDTNYDSDFMHRRERCRVNQARYRNKQRNTRVQLEIDVEQLHHKVNSLSRRYRELSMRERRSHNPWSIVTEVFHLLESSFRSPWRVASAREMMAHPQSRLILAVLKRALAHDAAMGDLRGVEALMEQLRLYSQCFEGSQLRLKRIETVSADVLAARAELSVTLTESTLKHVLPRLAERHGGDVDDRLYKRLLGQQLDCECSMIFLFDADTKRVVRLETIIDPMVSLLRLTGNLENVLDIVENARISAECTIDNHTD
ncbi:unnamed protein product [Phytophthora fragariaefolia]|uniref:Unnamed protein product n=1 Tax=Phytophthora fragariaefolia TaxID=1490495 RepID=A0A9W6WW83_9STRA|nr:unnamed protein product [Phytophthora fragariaefolia]